MTLNLLLWSVFLAALSASAHEWNATCTTKSQRKAWNTLTDAEKAAYIEAELCLQSSPAQVGIVGALNRWDELHWSHISQSNWIHGVGGFLPWHRYFVRVHEYLLQSECGYEGGQPYWDEPLDIANLSGSVIFDTTTGFGGKGSSCINGPFADLRLHFDGRSTTANYCVTRQIESRSFSGASQDIVDKCMDMTTYETAWNCIENSGPHNAGHGGVGGTMVNVQTSPGDPIFYLHHAYIDMLWWQWQELDLETRLVEMGGRNTPGQGTLDALGLSAPTEDVTAYDGDPGSTTTLNHILGMVEIVPNATIAEVMDIRGNIVCAEYIDE